MLGLKKRRKGTLCSVFLFKWGCAVVKAGVDQKGNLVLLFHLRRWDSDLSNSTYAPRNSRGVRM